MSLKALLAIAATALIAIAPVASYAQAADGSTLPAGTKVYLTLDEAVTSARGGFDVGAIVRCSVWRDVTLRGAVVIKGGTPATCRVSKISRRNMGGTEGKVAIAGVDTKSLDGQNIVLAGGYDKEGAGHKAVVWTVGMLLFWPALFVPGGNAELPPGTVFDTSTVNDLSVQPALQAQTPRAVSLSGLVGGLNAEFMVDDFLDQPNHRYFHVKLSKDGDFPKNMVVDNVNGKQIDPVSVTLKDLKKDGDTATGTGEIDAKSLAKFFVRGINRFNLTYSDAGQSRSTEVIMNVQM